jgi:hypothetical protein
MVKFAYDNTVHSSTQQTPLFANHGLQPKFDIQGVHKDMSPTVEDWAMWLANVWVQLISNLEKTQRWYKENVDEHWKEQTNFKVENQVWLWQQHIKTTRPSKKLDY